MSTEMTIDQVIALAASIGACMSAIAAFLVVRQVSRQREFSYRPELVLARTIFECITNPLSKGKIPDTWINEAKEDEERDYIRSFTIPLRNVGLGAAKGVRVNWSFPIEELVSSVNEMAQKSLIPAYFEYENKMLSLKSDNLGGSTSMWGNQQESTIDFVLPAPVDQTPVELAIPHAYIQIISALVYFSAKADEFNSFPEIPALAVELHYFDIGGEGHKSQYLISTNIVAVMNKGEAFNGYLESAIDA